MQVTVDTPKVSATIIKPKMTCFFFLKKHEKKGLILSYKIFSQ